MASRPTIQDVSQESGVSVATVDRVLNGRTKVREETARRVYDAALKVGYHAAGLIKQRLQAELPEYRLGFILQKQKQVFYQNFAFAIESAARRYSQARIVIDIVHAQTQSAAEYCELMRGLSRRSQAIGAMAIDHHDVTAEVVELRARNIACFAMLSDFAQGVRQSYVGLNNIRVGRGSAWMLSKVARPGKIALFVGGHRWHGHELRETGFRSYFREYAPDFQVLDTLVNLETRQLTYEATLDLLARHPDLSGLYCAGGGMEGAIEALRESRKPDEVALIVNEDTPETRKALHDRYVTMVNVTPLDKFCDTLIELMVLSVVNGASDIPAQQFLPQGFLFSEMI